jgi:hypothetical protein
MSHATIAPWRDRWFIACARFASRYKDDGSVTFHVTTPSNFNRHGSSGGWFGVCNGAHCLPATGMKARDTCRLDVPKHPPYRSMHHY